MKFSSIFHFYFNFFLIKNNIIFSSSSSSSSSTSSTFSSTELTGKQLYDSGFALLQLGREQEASEAFWLSILKSSIKKKEKEVKNEKKRLKITLEDEKIDERVEIDEGEEEEEEEEYSIKTALEQFISIYYKRKIPELGLLKIGKQFKLQGLESEAIEYLTTVISMNSKLVEPHLLLSSMQSIEPNIRLKHMINALMIDPDGYHV